MAKKSSFDEEAKKKAIDKAMPEEETGIVQKIKRNVPIALKYLSGGEEAAYEQWKKGRDKAPDYDLVERAGEVGAESAVSEKKERRAAYWKAQNAQAEAKAHEMNELRYGNEDEREEKHQQMLRDSDYHSFSDEEKASLEAAEDAEKWWQEYYGDPNYTMAKGRGRKGNKNY